MKLVLKLLQIVLVTAAPCFTAPWQLKRTAAKRALSRFTGNGRGEIFSRALRSAHGLIKNVGKFGDQQIDHLIGGRLITQALVTVRADAENVGRKDNSC